MGQVAITTPVTAGHEEELELLLSNLPRDKPPGSAGPVTTDTSPFTGVLPPTHFARLVVIALGERHHLFFSSRFDGGTHDYLRALAATETAHEIWSHCTSGQGEAGLTPDTLGTYLCDEDHWLSAQYVVSAIPLELTVSQINRALSLRTQLSDLMVRAARIDATALAHEFRQLPAIRTMLDRR